MRVITASGIEPSAIAGRIRCLIVSESACQSRSISASRMKKLVGCFALLSTSSRPTLGSTCHLIAKRYLRMIARKKIGIEIPSNDPTSVALSKTPPWRFAAK